MTTTETPAAAVNDWTTARNARTTYYEVHATGCRHLSMPHMEVMWGTESSLTGAEFATYCTDNNDGCIYKTGPCAR